jgi:hypothetical protein
VIHLFLNILGLPVVVGWKNNFASFGGDFKESCDFYLFKELFSKSNCWYMLVIPATWEVQANLERHYLKNKIQMKRLGTRLKL